MDRQEFERLLQSILLPDTETVKTATATLRKEYYKDPQCLAILFQIFSQHPSADMRQLAAVQARTLVIQHWDAIPDSSKPEIRQMLLRTALDEKEARVRHAAARVISAVASVDFEKGQWTDLPGTLEQAALSADAAQRETSVFILFSLMEVMADGFTENLGRYLSLFKKTIRDPQSSEVRINTLQALGIMGSVLEPEDDPTSVQTFHEMLPDMVAVLKEAVDGGDEKQVETAFDVFQSLLTYDWKLISRHFKDLVEFMVNMAGTKSLSSESRTQAIQFLSLSVDGRKTKMQQLKVGEALTVMAMDIVSELDINRRDSDAEEDNSPAKAALSLLDSMAQSLPATQVGVPLMKALPKFVANSDPAYRRGGIMSVGFCVEGAPDFFATQLDQLVPAILKLCADSDVQVRLATIRSIARIASDLTEALADYTDSLVEALVQNLDAGTSATGSGTAEQEELKVDIISAACNALDYLVLGVDEDTAAKYIPELIPRFSRLYHHPSNRVRMAAISATGSLADSSEEQFQGCFEEIMQSLSGYMTKKEGSDELDLRAIVCDAMANIASAVGGDAFKKFVQPLMSSSEEALHLDHPGLKESSYYLWSTLARLYNEDFTPFVDGVMSALLESLEQEEPEFDEEAQKNLEQILGADVDISNKNDKKTVTISSIKDDDDNVIDVEDLEIDDDAWADFSGGSIVATEKEMALEAISEVMSNVKGKTLSYAPKVVEKAIELADHPYEGARKAALTTLLRIYASCWQASEESGENTGWEPGLPLKVQPPEDLIGLGKLVMTTVLSAWENEGDREVVTEIHRSVGATLRACGPAIVSGKDVLHSITTILLAVVQKKHPCQSDDLDDDVVDTEEEESSEYDWLIIDTALDALAGLSKALGPSFAELWKIFGKTVLKFTESKEGYERTTSVGATAECIQGMGPAMTPYTTVLLKLMVRKLADEDPEVQSNAAFGCGIICAESKSDNEIIAAYPAILQKLAPFISAQNQTARLLDNASGCVSRMIMKHPDKVPLKDVLPALFAILPLTEDYDENDAVWNMIVQMYQMSNPIVQEQTPKLVPIMAKVLSPPEEQLSDEVREKVKELVKFLHKNQPGLIASHPVLVEAAQG